MAKDILELNEVMSNMNRTINSKINNLAINVKWLNEKAYDQDDLLKGKLAELEKVESDLIHLHDDIK